MKSENYRKWGIVRTGSTAEISEKYAALRSLANKSGDHLAELDIFASEMRSRRFWQDHPFGSGAGRFWFGLIYGSISDFGRSVWRPLIIWLLALFAGVCLHLVAFAFETNVSFSNVLSVQCVEGTENPLAESTYLSLAHGAVFGMGNPERVKIAQRCLFGVENSATGLSSVPRLPISMAIFSIFHSFIAGICFFLAGLAIRNNFRA